MNLKEEIAGGTPRDIKKWFSMFGFQTAKSRQKNLDDRKTIVIKKKPLQKTRALFHEKEGPHCVRHFMCRIF
jgi:hypothetical protein